MDEEVDAPHRAQVVLQPVVHARHIVDVEILRPIKSLAVVRHEVHWADVQTVVVITRACDHVAVVAAAAVAPAAGPASVRRGVHTFP